MGKIKHKNKILTLFKKTPVVSISSLKKIISGKGNYVSVMLNKMIKQKQIYRITQGKYSISDDPTLAVFCFKPAYLGLQEALSIHNLWEQETNVIILTVKTVREGIRKINDSNVLLRRIPKELFFGVEYLQYGEFYLPVSDIEKTFLDLIYFQQPIDRKLLAQFRKKVDKKKLKRYLSYYDRTVKDKVESLLK